MADTVAQAASLADTVAQARWQGTTLTAVFGATGGGGVCARELAFVVGLAYSIAVWAPRGLSELGSVLRHFLRERSVGGFGAGARVLFVVLVGK